MYVCATNTTELVWLDACTGIAVFDESDEKMLSRQRRPLQEIIFRVIRNFGLNSNALPSKWQSAMRGN